MDPGLIKFFTTDPKLLHQVMNHPKGTSFLNRSIVSGGQRKIANGSGLLLEDKETIKKYTWMASAVNRGTRDGKLSGIGLKFKDRLEVTLTKLPNYQGVVFRGVSHLPPDVLSVLTTEGSIYVDKAFGSASRFSKTASRSALFNEDGVFLVIQSKTGKSIENLSEFKHEEREVLFPPGAKMRVDMVFHTKQYTSGGAYVAFLTEI